MMATDLMTVRPVVYAVCLTADRGAFTDRAVRSFLHQTYTPRRMLVLDTGVQPYQYPVHLRPFAHELQIVWLPSHRGHTIGALRNTAADLAADANILMHWDSDDWSSPHRMSVQVAALTEEVEGKTPALCVGFNQVVFWNSIRCEAWEYRQPGRRDYAIGTSLAYWREAWSAREFPGTSCGEEIEFARGRCESESAIPEGNYIPLLVAEVHGQNTTSKIIDTADEWKRSPWRDAKIRRLMEL